MRDGITDQWVLLYRVVGPDWESHDTAGPYDYVNVVVLHNEERDLFIYNATDGYITEAVDLNG